MRRIPDEHLAYPVLITAPPSIGSGFFLNTGKAFFLVTARHVLIDPQTGNLWGAQATLTSPSRDPAEHTRNVLTLDLGALVASQDLRSDAGKDVATIRMGTVQQAAPGAGAPYVLQAGPGVATTAGTTGGVVSVSLDTVRLYANVLESNETYIFGYPSSLGIQNVPQVDYTRPLLRRGIIAGKNAARRVIIIDSPVYPGNSGGPVMELEQESVNHYLARIIGVVLEFVPAVQNQIGPNQAAPTQIVTNSGYTVVASMDDVMALIDTF